MTPTRTLHTYRVTLDITLDERHAPPSEWDWVELLDGDASPGLLIGAPNVARVPLDREAAECLYEYDLPIEVAL
jgi:hypothetical protein